MLRAFQIPYAGAVVVSIPDGRVLAMVGRSAAEPRLGPAELALHAWAPSASVFKVVSATALVRGRRLGRDPHLLPRRRLVDPARQPGRHPGHRPPLRHAGLRPRQVAERHRRQAGEPHLTADAAGARGARLRLRRGDPLRAPRRAVAPGRAGRRAGVRAHRGRLLALDAVADARRAAGGDDRQRTARCPRPTLIERAVDSRRPPRSGLPVAAHPPRRQPAPPRARWDA